MGDQVTGGLPPDGHEPACDLLVVDVSRRGLRARRTGAEPEARIEPPRSSHTKPQVVVEIGELVESIAPLVEAVARPPDQVVVSLRSARSSLDPAELRARLTVVTSAPVVVCDATVATLFGALGHVGAGTVVDLGASVAGLATDVADVWHRIDGWGPILGDRGSAAWIGAQGLASALRFRDGVPGGSEQLLAAGRHSFGDELHWPTLLNENSAAEVLADFAPVVGEIAARGDEVAMAIIRLSGEHLADALTAGRALVPDGPLVATGELLLIDAVKVSLASALGRRITFLMPAMGDSLAGARLLAEHLAAGGDVPHRPPFVYTNGQAAISA